MLHVLLLEQQLGTWGVHASHKVTFVLPAWKRAEPSQALSAPKWHCTALSS